MVKKIGITSILLKCETRNRLTRETIITIESITMVILGTDGNPKAHGKTEIEFVKDRLDSN
jgi:hypothetical protein